MNCQEFWNTMPELARTPDRSTHLRDCTACDARMRQQHALSAGLRAIASDWAHAGASPQVEARLIDAFRGHSGLGRVETVVPRLPSMWMPVATWLTAVAAVVVLAVFLMQGNQPKP